MKKIHIVLAVLCFICGIASTTQTTEAATNFLRRPLNIAPSPLVNYYYDNDRRETYKKDYMCTYQTYDDSDGSGGHVGTDFNASVGVPIYASASGGLYSRVDGCPTYGYLGSTCGSGYGNNARIDHAGNFYDGVGQTTIYAHMQIWSVAAGPFLYACGQQIGLTGSSGSSGGPHLHFELRSNGYDKYSRIDPFAGSCSHPESYWVNQNGGTPTTQCL